MNKFIAPVTLSALLAVTVIAALPTFAAEAPNYDATGNYIIAMHTLGSDATHDMSLTQDASGNLTGSGGSPAGANVYLWTITSGSVSSSTIDFSANYTATADAVTPQTVLHVNGAIASDGSMSGTWSDNYQGNARTGTWETTSGHAVPIVAAVHTITASAGAHGSISPSGAVSVANAESQTFTITPDSGYQVDTITVDGSAVADASMYTFDNVTVNHTIAVTFSAIGSNDSTPDAFSFVDKTDVALSTLISSNKITVSGINVASAISVTGGEYSVNGGAYTSANGSVNNGDMVRVRQTSSASNSTSVNTTLTIGGVSDTFTSTTLAVGATTGPTDKDQCKNDGWKNFTDPSFKNQGQCIAFVAHLSHGQGDNDNDDNDHGFLHNCKAFFSNVAQDIRDWKNHKGEGKSNHDSKDNHDGGEDD